MHTSIWLISNFGIEKLGFPTKNKSTISRQDLAIEINWNH